MSKESFPDDEQEVGGAPFPVSLWFQISLIESQKSPVLVAISSLRKGALSASTSFSERKSRAEQATQSSRHVLEGGLKNVWRRARKDRDFVVGGLAAATLVASLPFGKFAVVRNTMMVGGFSAYMVHLFFNKLCVSCVCVCVRGSQGAAAK